MKHGSADVALRLGSELLVRLCGFATLPLLTRSLGSDGYGTVVGSGAIVGFFAAIGSLGLSYHVGRIVGRGETAASRLLLRRLILLAGASGVFWALALALAAPFLNGWLLGHHEGALAIALSGGSLIATCIDGILLEWLRLRGRFKSLSLIQAGAALLQLAVLVAVARSGWGPAVVVACASAVQLLRVAAMAAFIRGSGRAAEVADADFSLGLGTCIRDGAALTLGGLGAWGLGQGGRLVLGSAAAIGGYGAAAALATIPGVAGSACGLPLYPTLVRAVAARRPRAAATAIRRFSTTYQVLTLPVLAIAMVLAGDAIRLVAGPGFDGLGWICRLLLLAGWIEMSALPLNYLTSAHGWASRIRNAQLAAAAVSLLAAVLLVPHAGGMGVALAVVAGQLGMLALLAWGVRHAAFPWRALVPRCWIRILAATAAGGAAAALIPSSTWSGLLLAGSAAVAVAGAVIASHWIAGKSRRFSP